MHCSMNILKIIQHYGMVKMGEHISIKMETAYDAISQDPSNEDAWLSHIKEQ